MAAEVAISATMSFFMLRIPFALFDWFAIQS
jgi:hypothetical protein